MSDGTAFPVISNTSFSMYAMAAKSITPCDRLIAYDPLGLITFHEGNHFLDILYLVHFHIILHWSSLRLKLSALIWALLSQYQQSTPFPLVLFWAHFLCFLRLNEERPILVGILQQPRALLQNKLLQQLCGKELPYEANPREQRRNGSSKRRLRTVSETFHKHCDEKSLVEGSVHPCKLQAHPFHLLDVVMHHLTIVSSLCQGRGHGGFAKRGICTV